MSSIGRFLNFGSSSQGNCIYIELEPIVNGLTKRYKLILEAGFDFNYILKMMTKNGISLNEIDGVLVTHEHADHSKAVLDFIKRGIPVFAPKETFDKLNVYASAKHRTLAYEWLEIFEGVSVLGLPMEHYDSDKKITNYAYIINLANDFNILFATDTKYIPQDLSNFKFDVILIEANYLEDTVSIALRDAQKTSNMNNIARYARLVDSHMSLENLARTLDGSISNNAKPFDLSKTKFIGLLHLSSNATTNTMYYKEFIKNYLIKTKDKTNVKDNINIRVLKKDGGFL